ncbi:hypothetical protein Tco_0079635 [Tanacetum coccineum]
MKFGVSSWHGSRVDGRSYLLSGAIDGSEANRIISDFKQEVWNDCMSCKVRISSNGNLLWEASVFLGRKKVETLKFAAMPFGLTNAPAVFMELMSRVCIYDARSKDLETCLEKGREGDCWLTNRWLSMKKVIASCGSKYLAYLEVEVEYQGSSGFVDTNLSNEYKQDLGFIPSGNVVLSSTYVGKILGADQLLVILCYRYQESGIGYWILSMTISGSGVTFLPSCCDVVRSMAV